jgi:energy-coupling factor transporter ATP-binding protein EcfA2
LISEADGGGFLTRRTWGLSGGEKRLLSVAGAIIAPAALLALDEPTAGLDQARGLAGIIMVIGPGRLI